MSRLFAGMPFTQALHNVACCLVIVLATAHSARADGWHSAILDFSGFDEWAADSKNAVKRADQALGNTTARAGRIEDILAEQKKGGGASSNRVALIDGNLTAQDRALLERKARDACTVLAYMIDGNIYDHEYRTFCPDKATKAQNISEARSKCKQFLTQVGPIGSAAVVQELCNVMMGVGPGGAAEPGLTIHPEYTLNLLQAFRASLKQKDVTSTDVVKLLRAADGQANPLLAKQVIELLLSYENASIDQLIQWREEITDRRLRKKIDTAITRRLADALPEDLIAVLGSKLASSTIKRQASAELRSMIPSLTVLQLLMILEVKQLNHEMRKQVAGQLEQTKVRYRNVKKELPEITRLAESPIPIVAKGAEWVLRKAYMTAPIEECINAVNVAGGDDLISTCIDKKIKRADPDRQAKYMKTALSIMMDANRLKLNRDTARFVIDQLPQPLQQQATVKVIEALRKSDRSLWGEMGAALQQWTGLNYGPTDGANSVEFASALRKWRKWLEEQGTQ